ncbi:terminal protein [Bacillus phage KonjoTrouble]|uniref:Terminal protein n=2 Tax=Claudivirus konjotrouble TaxID=2843774 RepID=A0A514AAK8_9CAUD|nr:DNA terminal protein [Bacillus phage KonjoTrouble]ASU04137.1 terminal protein [Bacillus phage KonjoTrouble]QDH50296.1 terminal protein [Bacillus phage VioletteMad]
MVKRRSKKQPKFTIRDVDVNEFNRLQNNAKAMIRSRKKKYGVDISGEIDLKTSISDFKTRKGFNAWKEAMSKLRYRADLQIKKVGDTVASQKQINQSQREVNVMKRKLQKVDGEYQNKYKVRFNEKQLLELTLQTNVARDMEIARQKQLESIPRFNKKGQQIKDVRKDKTGGTVIVRDKFDPTILDNNQRVKIREYNLKQVSDPERYSRREQQLKENQLTRLKQAFGSDAEDVIRYIEDMNSQEFNNFYFMFMDSSLGFNEFDSEQYIGQSAETDDQLLGAIEAIRTDIQRYDKNREKYKMLMKY